MELLNRIYRKIKRGLDVFFYSEEERYYKNLFVDDPRWNAVSLNEDQVLRWNAIRNSLEKIKPSSKSTAILDVGCSNGWLTNLLSHYGAVTGIEPVSSVVQYGKKRYPNLRLLSGDLPFFRRKYPLEKFDIIVSSEVIEHVPDTLKKEFVADIRDLLNPGAHVIITTPRKEVLPELASNPNQPIEEWLTEADVRQLFGEDLFEVIEFTRLIPPDSANLEIYQVWLFKLI